MYVGYRNHELFTRKHAPIQHDLLLKRQQVKENIYQRLQQGVKEGDLNPHANIQAMTDYYSTVIQGLTMQARDGVSTEQLQSVVIFGNQNLGIILSLKRIK